jgi:ribosomal protein S17E
MKRVYELDVYKLAEELSEELSDMVWHDFDKWNKKVQNTVGYQIIRSTTVQKHEGQISNF